MSLKHMIFATVAWILLVMAGGIGIASYLHGKRAPGASARATQLGQAMGTLAAVGCGAIWLPYAAKIGAERRAGGKKKKSTKKKRA